MNVEDIRKELARLTAMLEQLESEPAGVDPEYVGPMVLGDDGDDTTWNFWHEYNLLKQEEVTPLAPVLEIPEFADQYGDWFWDGDMAFIYKPLLDMRDQWLAGRHRRGNKMRSVDARNRRYAALTNPGFAYKYATLPAGFNPNPGYLDWLRLVRNQAQRVKIMFGWKHGYAQFPVYDEFDSTVGINALDNDVAVPASVIPGIYYISGGNLLGEETLLDAHRRACKSFEVFWSKYEGSRRMVNSAKWELRMLDRRFNELNSNGKEQFLLKNPGYDPA